MCCTHVHAVAAVVPAPHQHGCIKRSEEPAYLRRVDGAVAKVSCEQEFVQFVQGENRSRCHNILCVLYLTETGPGAHLVDTLQAGKSIMSRAPT